MDIVNVFASARIFLLHFCPSINAYFNVQLAKHIQLVKFVSRKWHIVDLLFFLATFQRYEIIRSPM